MKVIKFINKHLITFIVASLLLAGLMEFLNIVLLDPNMSSKRDYNLYVILPIVLVLFGYFGGLFIYLFLRLAGKVQSLAIFRNLYAFGILVLIFVFLALMSIQIYSWLKSKEALFLFSLFALPGLIIMPSRAFDNSTN